MSRRLIIYCIALLLLVASLTVGVPAFAGVGVVSDFTVDDNLNVHVEVNCPDNVSFTWRVAIDTLVNVVYENTTQFHDFVLDGSVIANGNHTAILQVRCPADQDDWQDVTTAYADFTWQGGPDSQGRGLDDIIGHCHDQDMQVRNTGGAYGWNCQDDDGNLHPIDFRSLCAEVYGDELPFVHVGDPTSTASISCTNNSALDNYVSPSQLEEGVIYPDCGIAPEPRLVIGQRGRNVPDGDATHIRTAPRAEEFTGSLIEDEEFVVLSGPICRESVLYGNLYWWEIRSENGEQGWIPEGATLQVPEGVTTTEYFVEPIASIRIPGW